MAGMIAKYEYLARVTKVDDLPSLVGMPRKPRRIEDSPRSEWHRAWS